MINKSKIYLEKFILKFWYEYNDLKIWIKYIGLSILYPLSLIYTVIIYLRKKLYANKIFKTNEFKVPIIIVGNLTVGGTGKTPVVIALVKILQQQGFKIGIVSRGYVQTSLKLKLSVMPVLPTSDPDLVGDEPVLIARRTECKVYVAKQRSLAVSALLQADPEINLIIADDGLQHYALARDLEIVVVDSKRSFGNGYCLPAGPLREPISRLADVDLILDKLELNPIKLLYNLFDPQQTIELNYFKHKTVHAIAGISDPEKFFTELDKAGLNILRHSYSDHYVYKPTDLVDKLDHPLIMTEKDAVKCEKLTLNKNCWVLPIEIKFSDEIQKKIKELINGR